MQSLSCVLKKVLRVNVLIFARPQVCNVHSMSFHSINLIDFFTVLISINFYIDFNVDRKTSIVAQVSYILKQFYLHAQNACHGTLKNTKISS
jgi:hypothetical protein